MSQEETIPNLKKLKRLRFVYICGAVLSAITTLAAMIYTAIVWFDRAEPFSADWWGAAGYALLTFPVLVIDYFMVSCTFDNAGWSIPFPRWLWLETMCAGFFLSFFYLTPLILFCWCHHLTTLETHSAPVGWSLLAAGAFYASIPFCCVLIECCVNIREIVDPNFKRNYGFS